MNYSCGIDLSFTSTGLIILNDKFEVCEKKIFKSDNKEILEKRIIFLYKYCFDIFNDFKQYGLKINLEGLSYGSVGQATLDLAALHFFVRTQLLLGEFDYQIIPPTTLKKFITGKGQCKKDLMLLKVFQKFGIEFTTSDLADAYSLARYGFEG